MRHPLLNMTESIDRQFYFGIGGIGDGLLLLSTFYNNIDEHEVDVIFVANNIKPFHQLIPIFSKVHKFWLFPRKAFPLTLDVFKILNEQNNRLRGTGVTPKRFDYKEEWNKVEKSSVFEYYGVQRRLYVIDRWDPTLNAPIVIQPFGGDSDPTKVKQLSKKLLHQIVDIDYKQTPIIFIGSNEDIKRLQKIDWSADRESITYCTDIQQSIMYIRGCSRFIGTDSWGKTAAALAGIDNIDVYKNKYINATPQQLFGQDTDPGDFVFLHNWGFNILEDPEVF